MRGIWRAHLSRRLHGHGNLNDWRLQALCVERRVVHLASNSHILQRQPFDVVQEPRLRRVHRRAEIAVGDRHIGDRHHRRHRPRTVVFRRHRPENHDRLEARRRLAVLRHIPHLDVRDINVRDHRRARTNVVAGRRVVAIEGNNDAGRRVHSLRLNKPPWKRRLEQRRYLHALRRRAIAHVEIAQVAIAIHAGINADCGVMPRFV